MKGAGGLGDDFLPDVGGLCCELCGHEGEVFPQLDPQVGFGNAAVVRMDSVDPCHLHSNQSAGELNYYYY